ncbi:MAG: hypothetical protein CMI02_11720 [Oceanospirillaceae bacterium]|nr:hypothetical protein [Oceanospirillaceae bacterium]MBT12687.1 hypothetical protein [Oceanospirillaceae bacterium]|tara:strand:- start:77900 stop:78229 length:330 start_codon:yes stop_codon:yes gene_type:complete
MADHPGRTRGGSGTLPVTGSSCGIRPDPDALSDDVGFDFSAAAGLLAAESAEESLPDGQNSSASDTTGTDDAEASDAAEQGGDTDDASVTTEDERHTRRFCLISKLLKT